MVHLLDHHGRVRVTVHQAKTQLSAVLRRVAAGEDVIILNRQRPVARIVALTPKTRRDLRGDLKGKIRIAPDFDETPSDFRAYS